MNTLYDIDADFLAAVAAITERVGEPTVEQIEALELNAENWQEKARNYLRVISDLKHYEDACTAEIARISAKKDAAESRREYLHGRLLQSMTARGMGKTEVGTWTLSLRESESVDVPDDAEMLPAEYRRVKVYADKRAIGEALKNGIAVDGCSIVKKQNLIYK